MSFDKTDKAILEETAKIINRPDTTPGQDIEDIRKLLMKYGVYKEKTD